MIYATADIDLCIPINNLPTVNKHYKTYTNLCLTIRNTLETCCNLSTATDPQHQAFCSGTAAPVSRLKQKMYDACGTPDNLSSNIMHLF